MSSPNRQRTADRRPARGAKNLDVSDDKTRLENMGQVIQELDELRPRRSVRNQRRGPTESYPKAPRQSHRAKASHQRSTEAEGADKHHQTATDAIEVGEQANADAEENVGADMGEVHLKGWAATGSRKRAVASSAELAPGDAPRSKRLTRYALSSTAADTKNGVAPPLATQQDAEKQQEPAPPRFDNFVCQGKAVRHTTVKGSDDGGGDEGADDGQSGRPAGTAVEKVKRVRGAAAKRVSGSGAAAARRRPSQDMETQLQSEGYRAVGGVDEAGRGPLAGPVVAAVVVLPSRSDPAWLPPSGLNDSKAITEKEREAVYEQLTTDPRVEWAVSVVDHHDIDRINILQAALEAMRQSAEKLIQQHSKEHQTGDPALPAALDFLLVDGNRMPKDLPVPARTVVKGDATVSCIAAASCIAKVTRDRLMMQLDAQFPQYGFAQHKGYGVPAHMAAIRKHGPSAIHRRSFEPIKSMTGWSREMMLREEGIEQQQQQGQQSMTVRLMEINKEAVVVGGKAVRAGSRRRGDACRGQSWAGQGNDHEEGQNIVGA